MESSTITLQLSSPGEGVGRGVGYSLPHVGGGRGQAHCWVLKDQPSRPARERAGCVVGLLFLSSSVSPRVGVWGLVGLLFEICIVDASIFTARNRSGVMPGGWCVVSV